MLKLRSRTPTPEAEDLPPDLSSYFPPLTCVLFVVWFVFLILATKGYVFKTPYRIDWLWRCWPLSLAVFAIAQHELQPQMMDPFELNEPGMAITYTLPVAGFGLLLLAEAVNYIFNRLGPRRLYTSLSHPVMSVHAIALLYYVTEPWDVKTCALSRGRAARARTTARAGRAEGLRTLDLHA